MAIRCISKAVILENGFVLLNKCKHEDGNIYYGLPGGGQNAYETLEQAVVREVKEETGYDVYVNGFIALVEESVWIPLNSTEQLKDTCSPWLINLLINLEKGNIPLYLGTEYIE